MGIRDTCSNRTRKTPPGRKYEKRKEIYMSKTSNYETEIRIPEPPKTNLVSRAADLESCPNIETLKNVVEKVARDHGGTTSRYYVDNAGKKHNVWMAFNTSLCPKGIGIIINRNGSISYSYDTYTGNENAARNICAEIKQGYIAVQLLRSLSKLGFTVEASEQIIEGNQKNIIVSARRQSGTGVLATVGNTGRILADFNGYPGHDCVKDEDALCNGLRMNGVEPSIINHRGKPDDPPTASWNNPRGKLEI
jgi:hypothetical protein